MGNGEQYRYRSFEIRPRYRGDNHLSLHIRFKGQTHAKDSRGFQVFTTQKFFIGDKEFGAKDLFLYDIAPELKEIDGMLGMDFLEKHIVYIKTTMVISETIKANPRDDSNCCAIVVLPNRVCR